MNAMLANLWTTTAQAALLAGIVFVITKLGSRWIPPAWRAAMWMLVIVRLLVPVAPPSVFSLQNVFAKEAAAPVAATFTGTPKVEILGPEVSPNELRYVANVVPAAPAPKRISAAALLVAVWLTGAGLCAVALVLKYVRLRRAISGTRTPVIVEEALAATKKELRLRYPIRVSVSDLLAAPALTGALPARLIVPADAERMGSGQLRHVLLHELAHIKLGHLVFHWLGLIARCAHWFNPIAHFAVARLRHECELAADAVALAKLNDQERPEYGETILQALARATGSHSALSLAMAHRTRHLEDRLRALEIGVRSKWNALLGAVLLVALTACGLTSANKAEKPTGNTADILIDASKFAEPMDMPTFAKTLSAQARGMKVKTVASTNKNVPSAEGFTIRMPSPQGMVPLEEFLDRAAESAQRPAGAEPTVRLVWSMEGRGIKFFTEQPGALVTRVFKLKDWIAEAERAQSPTTRSADVDAFLRSIDATNLLAQPFVSDDADAAERVNRARAESVAWLKDYLRLAGAAAMKAPGHTPGASLAWNFDRSTGDLLVRAPEREMDKIEHALAMLRGPVKVSGGAAANLVARSFKLANPAAFSAAINPTNQNIPKHHMAAAVDLRKLVAELKGEPAPLTGTEASKKALFFNDRTGGLFVRATEAEIDRLVAAITVLAAAPRVVQQVTFRAEILETSAETADQLLKELVPSRSFNSTNELIIVNGAGDKDEQRLALSGSKNLLAGVKDAVAATNFVAAGREYFVSPTRLKQFTEALGKAPGVERISAPTLTTIVGQQSRISIEDHKTIVFPTGVENLTPSGVQDLITPKTATLPFGPTLDLTATEFDGERLAYSSTLTMTDFLGYDTASTEKAPLPRFRVRQTSANTKVQPGLTHIFNIPSQDIKSDGKGWPELTAEAAKPATRRILIMITPTLTTPTGEMAMPEIHAK